MMKISTIIIRTGKWYPWCEVFLPCFHSLFTISLCVKPFLWMKIWSRALLFAFLGWLALASVLHHELCLCSRYLGASLLCLHCCLNEGRASAAEPTGPCSSRHELASAARSVCLFLLNIDRFCEKDKASCWLPTEQPKLQRHIFFFPDEDWLM